MADTTTTRTTLRIKQGATFRLSGVLRAGGEPYPWNGSEQVRMMLREDYDSPTVASLTNASNGGIVLGPEAGRFRAVIPASRTALLPANSFGVFDLEVVFPAGEGENEPDVRRPLEGDYEVSPEVTKP